MLRIEIEKKEDLVATGFEQRTPAWESNVTTTAPANYVFKIESSFYIITYSNLLNSNHKHAERVLPSEDFHRYLLISKILTHQ